MVYIICMYLINNDYSVILINIYPLGVLCMPGSVLGGEASEFLKLIWNSLYCQQSEWNKLFIHPEPQFSVL